MSIVTHFGETVQCDNRVHLLTALETSTGSARSLNGTPSFIVYAHVTCAPETPYYASTMSIVTDFGETLQYHNRMYLFIADQTSTGSACSLMGAPSVIA